MLVQKVGRSTYQIWQVFADGDFSVNLLNSQRVEGVRQAVKAAAKMLKPDGAVYLSDLELGAEYWVNITGSIPRLVLAERLEGRWFSFSRKNQPRWRSRRVSMNLRGSTRLYEGGPTAP